MKTFLININNFYLFGFRARLSSKSISLLDIGNIVTFAYIINMLHQHVIFVTYNQSLGTLPTMNVLIVIPLKRMLEMFLGSIDVAFVKMNPYH